MIDCHWCFDKSQAKNFINKIEQFSIEWVEALIPEETHMAPDLKSLRDHANNKGIKMSGGEFLSGFDAFLPMLGQSCYDVINPDLRFCGIKDMCRLADLAEKKQILFSPHNPVGPLNEIASAHICATTQAFYLLEKQYCESTIAESLIDDSSCPLVNGERELSTGHGWGLSLTENSRANLVAD